MFGFGKKRVSFWRISQLPHIKQTWMALEDKEQAMEWAVVIKEIFEKSLPDPSTLTRQQIKADLQKGDKLMDDAMRNYHEQHTFLSAIAYVQVLYTYAHILNDQKSIDRIKRELHDIIAAGQIYE